VITLGGNTLTVIAFIKFHNLRKLKNYFLVSLAVGDTFLGVINMSTFIFIVAPSEYWRNVCGTPVFFITPTVAWITTVLSYLHILVITTDCFLCIMKPLHYHQMMTPRRAKIVIAIIWIAPVALGSVYLINEVFIEVCRSTNHLSIYRSLLRAILWSVVVFVVVVMYLRILLVIRKQKRQITTALSSHQPANTTNSSGSESGSYGNANKQTKQVAMVFLIIISFIVLWCPTITLELFTDLYPDSLASGTSSSTIITISIICHTIAFANSAVNAFIYARMDKEFRKAYKQILQCKWNSTFDRDRV
jgi:hypothetical protein